MPRIDLCSRVAARGQHGPPDERSPTMTHDNRPAWAHYAENLPAARAAGYDDGPADDGPAPTPYDAMVARLARRTADPDAPGRCGRPDYPLADCRLRTGGTGMPAADAGAGADRHPDDNGYDACRHPHPPPRPPPWRPGVRPIRTTAYPDSRPRPLAATP